MGSMNYRHSTQPTRKSIKQWFRNSLNPPVGRDEAISGLDEDTKLLENRMPHQYHNQGRVQPRRSRPSNVSEPFHSKASVSRREDRELDINETISRLRHMRKRVHRATAVKATTMTTATHHHQPSQPSFGFTADTYDPDDVVTGRSPLMTPLLPKQLEPSPSPPPDIPTTQVSLSPSFTNGHDKSNRHKIHPTSRDAVLVTYLDNNRDPKIARAAGLESLPCDKGPFSPMFVSQLAWWEYNARGEFGDLNEGFDLAMTNTNHQTTNERTCDQEALNKTPGTYKIAARDDVDAADYDPSAYLARYQSPNSQSSKGHVQRQARHGFTRTSTRVAETSHTEFKPINNKIHSEVKSIAYLKARVYANDCTRDILVDSSLVNDDQTTDRAQENDNAVTDDERIADTSLQLNPPSHAAKHNTFVDQYHDMRDYQQRIRRRPHEQPHPDLIQQLQAYSAPTGHPISFHHSGSTQFQQSYQASLSNIRAFQSYRRCEVPVGIRKDKPFEKLSKIFSASGHYTISQDHTAGGETRRSHLLANFGRRHGANMNENEQLEVIDGKPDPPVSDIEFLSAWNKWTTKYHEAQENTIAPAHI